VTNQIATRRPRSRSNARTSATVAATSVTATGSTDWPFGPGVRNSE
jgi:hypothetical protein